jgi:hypothetical protein
MGVNVQNMPAGGFGIMGIIAAIITVAVGSAVGLAMVSATQTVFYGLNAGAAANNSFGNTTGIIYTSWPLLGLAVLGLIASAVLASIMIFR